MANSYPIDEKGIFNIFMDFEFVKPHKGAVVFLDCERVLVQYEKNTGPLSPGFIVPLRTEPGETYILETKGYLHEGKRAFIYGEAKGLTGGTGLTVETNSDPIDNVLNTPENASALSNASTFSNTSNALQNSLFGADVQKVPTILGFLEKPATSTSAINSSTLSTTSLVNSFRSAVGTGSAVGGVGTVGAGKVGATGHSASRIIPRDYFFKTCEESCFKICFTALTHCTEVGILFFNNTEDYCLSLSSFLVYKSSGRQGCCNNKSSCCKPGNCLACDNKNLKKGGNSETCCNNFNQFSVNNGMDPCSPCNPFSPCNNPCSLGSTSIGSGGLGSFMGSGRNGSGRDGCCDDNICIRTGPTGAQGLVGPTGCPGAAGTRTFALAITRQGFAGKTLPTLNCAVLGTFFLETSVSNIQIENAFAKCQTLFTDCVKLWQCNGSTFQWIIPTPSDYVFYDLDNLLIWIVQNQTATLLFSNPGDLIVDSITGDVLVGNSRGQFIFDGTNLKGPTGNQGPIGPTGPTGNPGVIGPQGPTGISLGTTSFITDILPLDFLVLPNTQGSLVNFVDISLDATSIPTGSITTSTFINQFSTQRKLDIEMTINNIEFASSVVSSEVAPGQHICGSLTIDLSTYLINQGFFPSFIGNPSVLVQVQQDDTAINTGYPNNVYSSLSNGLNQVRIVIIFYNAGPTSVDLLTFQTLINLSVMISGKVSLSN